MQKLQKRDTLLLVAFMLMMAMQISNRWLPTPDASGYISMANSLADSGQMTRLRNPHLYLNPGYPLLISPLFLGDGFPFWQVATAQWCFLTLFVVATYFWTRKYYPDWAVFIAILAGGNALVGVHYRRSLSELAFMAVMMWLLLMLQRATRNTSISRFSLLLFIIAILAGLLPAIRHAGIVVIFGFSVGLIITQLFHWFPGSSEKMTKPRLCLLLLILMGSATLGETAVILHEKQYSEQEKTETYLDRLDDEQLSLVMQMSEGIRLRAQDIGRLLIPGMFKNGVSADDSWRHPMAILYFVFALWLSRGWWLFLRETGDLLAISFPFYLGLHIVWPFDQGGRFLVPMSALLMLCLFVLFQRLLSRHSAILQRLVIGYLIVHLLVMLGHWIQFDLPDAAQAEQHWQELIPLVTRPVVLTAVEEAGLTEIIAVTPEAAKKNGFQVQVLTDQRFVRIPKDKPLPPEVRWILSKKEEAVPVAFELEMQSDSFKLWRRSPHIDH